MRMYEERDWYDCSEMIADLHNKINQYLAFIFSDQISEYKEYIGKPIVFMLYCQYIPPREIYPTLQDWKFSYECITSTLKSISDLMKSNLLTGMLSSLLQDKYCNHPSICLYSPTILVGSAFVCLKMIRFPHGKMTNIESTNDE